MKKYKVLILMSLLVTAFIFPKDITPVLSIRYDNLDDGITVSDAIGLKMDLGGNKSSGFDTDGTDYRLFVAWGFGKVGFGHDGATPNAKEQYTVGATYEVLDNLSLDLDYVMGSESGDANLRLGLQVHF